MGERQPRYSKEEFARRGQAIYEKRVRRQVEEGNSGKIVAIDVETGEIDVETGEFEMGEDTLAACDQLLARCPDAQPWLVRIGHRAVHRFGHSHAVNARCSNDLTFLMTKVRAEVCLPVRVGRRSEFSERFAAYQS